MRKTLVVVPAFAALLLLAGCSSGGKPAAQTLPPATTAATAPASTVGVAGSAAAGSLNAQLLAVTDLPAGWSSSSASSGTGGTASCSALNNRPWQTLPQRAEADFQESADGPFILEKLDAGSADQVTQAWTAFGTATSACRSFTSSTSGGTAQYTLSALSFPTYGDATYAFALSISESGLSASGDVVVVRKGDTLIQIMTVGLLGAVPEATVEQATSKAVAKVR
jgi:hypothetical protein